VSDPTELSIAKHVVLDYYEALDRASVAETRAVLDEHTTDDYRWRGVHPFHEQHGADAVSDVFWEPIKRAFSSIQRRPDIFLAGNNVAPGSDSSDEGWVCQMGHLLGLFDEEWLDIPPTRKMCFLRFAEFHRVEGDKIAETAIFPDVISVMRQAGHYPLPPATGASHIQWPWSIR